MMCTVSSDTNPRIDTRGSIIVFSMLIIMYLFLGGASSGAFLVMTSWSIYLHHTGYRRERDFERAFESLLARCYAISSLVLAFAILALFWDLAYPERVLYLFTRPHMTIITFGAFALSVELAVGILLTVAHLFRPLCMNGRIRKTLEIVCCVCSCVVMVYTGVFLASNDSVAFWNTWTLVALFFFSALSSGVSIVLLVDYFVREQTLLLRAARPLQKAHIVCLILEALAMAAFMIHALMTPAADGALSLLAEPSMLSNAVVGVIVMGICLPFALELYTLNSKECRTIPVSDVICLLGGFFLRYCVVLCGVR